MDNGTLALLIPVLALAIPVVAIVFSGLIKLAKARAEAETRGLLPEADARLEALEQEVGRLRQELGETQERVDFAERLLARGEENRRLGKDS
jgi:hypothetical protein